MKKQSFLFESQKISSTKSNNKSISPFTNFKKTPPKNVFTKTPPKQMMGVTFSAKVPVKKPQFFDPKGKNNRGKVYRNLTLHDELTPRSDVDNVEQSLTPRALNVIEEQYFSRSLYKVAQIRSRFSANTISLELNEVLNMIKQQKLKIGEKMKILKKNNAYYKRVCQGYVASTNQQGTNPIDIIDSGLDKIFDHKGTHIEEEEKAKMEEIVAQKRKEKQKVIKGKQIETYAKLYSMLEDMGIDYRSILPQSETQMGQSQQKVYKNLSEAETIKIQKFFIQKLASKLPK